MMGNSLKSTYVRTRFLYVQDHSDEHLGKWGKTLSVDVLYHTKKYLTQ